MTGPNRDLHHSDLDRLRTTETTTSSSNSNTAFDIFNAGLPFRARHAQPHESTSTKRERDDEDGDWAVPFIDIVLNTGDVLVYIDVPTLNNRRNASNCEGVVPHNLKFKVHSESLLALGDTKFKKLLLNPRKQKKWLAARKPTEQDMEGVKFVLDLTPDMEGDDRVFELAELSLTRGIVEWWAASSLHKVPQGLVGGHDDICSCQQQQSCTDPHEDLLSRANTDLVQPSAGETGTEESSSPESIRVSLPPTASDLLRLRAQGVNEVFATPSHYQIPDYCPFRHCNSIARLLLMVEGKSIRFHSAARVWTMVGISKIYDCPSVVRDGVVQWIMSNTRFVEVLPEEALRIGFNLSLPQITQSAFRILVNEMALEEAADPNQQNLQCKNFTIFGRRKEDPGDDKSNAIQHAARAFVERVRSQRDLLFNPAIFDIWASGDGVGSNGDYVDTGTEWKRLRSIENLLTTHDDGTFGDAIAALRSFMTAIVFKINKKSEDLHWASDHCRSAYSEMDKDRATYVKPFQYTQIQYILPSLTSDQRLLLPFFYNELGKQLELGPFWGQKSTHPDSRWKYFSHLLRDLEIELQKLIDTKTDRAYDDAWSILFRGSDTYQTMGPLFSEGRLVGTPLIDLQSLDNETRDGLRPITRAWERIDKGFVPQLNITRHMLLTLTQNEMKFLPLWAGGNDDGTGGVFEEPVPPAELGPNGPGPAYHTGITVPSDAQSLSESFVDDIRAFNIQGSTTAGSVAVHDDISTVYNRNHVIAADSSIAPSSYGDNDADYAAARFEVPAEHQGVGQAVAMMIDDDPNGAYDEFEIEDNDSDDTLTELGVVSDDEDQEMVDKSAQGNGREAATGSTDPKSSTSDSDNDSMVII